MDFYHRLCRHFRLFYFTQRLNRDPRELPRVLRDSEPFWNALRDDRVDFFKDQPLPKRLWMFSDSEQVLFEDTFWTAAARMGAKQCLLQLPKNSLLHEGQIIWLEKSGWFYPTQVGSNFLHSVAPITKDSDLLFAFRDWIRDWRLDVQATTDHGVQPIHAFAAHGHPTGIEMLMQAGADPLVKTQSGHYPIDLAKQFHQPQSVVDKLIYWGGLPPVDPL